MAKQFLLACVFILFTTFASGQYYQYTDKNGKLSFTDDISKVPKAQMDVVKKIEVDNQKANPVDAVTEQNKSTETTPYPSSGNGAENTFHLTAIELDTMQAELNKVRVALEDEKAAIETTEPKKGATKKDRLGYAVRIDAFNWNVSEYEKKLAVFNEKVDQFNAAKKQKAESKKK